MHYSVQQSAHGLISWSAWIIFLSLRMQVQCDCQERITSEAIHVNFFKQKLVSIEQEIETADVDNFDVTLKHNSTFSASRIYSVLS